MRSAGQDKKWDGTIEKSQVGHTWQHNVKNVIFKNGAFKCEQYLHKLADNCIKYIDLKFLR